MKKKIEYVKPTYFRNTPQQNIISPSKHINDFDIKLNLKFKSFDKSPNYQEYFKDKLYSRSDKLFSLSQQQTTQRPYKQLYSKYVSQSESKPRGYSLKINQPKTYFDEQSQILKKRLQAKIQQLKKKSLFKSGNFQNTQLTKNYQQYNLRNDQDTQLQRIYIKIQSMLKIHQQRQTLWKRQKKQLQNQVAQLAQKIKKIKR